MIDSNKAKLIVNDAFLALLHCINYDMDMLLMQSDDDIKRLVKDKIYMYHKYMPCTFTVYINDYIYCLRQGAKRQVKTN